MAPFRAATTPRNLDESNQAGDQDLKTIRQAAIAMNNNATPRAEILKSITMLTGALSCSASQKSRSRISHIKGADFSYAACT
eukprot:CAMPEP_0117464512 /NCGR_PEP_ID=MMETSP0784-20121206/4140_1 /TAXON_ID=39447 /ORGANISM="" /LENGTH=81 /DNA_ID=CAMNT_0005258375 /DNA_START=1064 /DNA_END=1306 /DNA_ORIENTATION=+